MKKKTKITLSILLIVIVSIAFLSYIIAAEEKKVTNKADGAEQYSCSQELVNLVGAENIDNVLVKAIIENGYIEKKFFCIECNR